MRVKRLERLESGVKKCYDKGTNRRGDMANIYDGAFRTILNDCRKLVIPVVNEIFGETYTGKEEIRFFPNEHFLDQQDAADQKRITDTNFTIFEKVPKKYHVECESGLPDGKMTIRLFEYDAQIALDEGDAESILYLFT